MWSIVFTGRGIIIVSKMPLELLGEVSIYFGIGVQVVTALFLGGMVGFDREKKSKSAGIKTNMLIGIHLHGQRRS